MRLNAYAAVSAWNSQANASAIVQKRQQSVDQLFSRLQSKDLAGAQKAFDEVVKNSPVLTPSSPMAQIGVALSKGQLADASQWAQKIASYKNNGASLTPKAPQNTAPPASASLPPSPSNWNPTALQRQAPNTLAQLMGQGSQIDLYA
jgi:hypothetical protein